MVAIALPVMKKCIEQQLAAARSQAVVGSVGESFGLAMGLRTVGVGLVVNGFFAVNGAIERLDSRGKLNQSTRDALSAVVCGLVMAPWASIQDNIVTASLQSEGGLSLGQACRVASSLLADGNAFAGLGARAMRGGIGTAALNRLTPVVEGWCAQLGVGKPLMQRSLAGALVGAATAAFAAPLEFIAQEQSLRPEVSAATVMAETLQRQGVAGFWVGAGPRTLQGAVATAALVTVMMVFERLSANYLPSPPEHRADDGRSCAYGPDCDSP